MYQPHPSVKEWSPEKVSNFLKSNKFNLYLEKEDIRVIDRLKYSGENYLQSTEKELAEFGFSPGAARRILKIIESEQSRLPNNDQYSQVSINIGRGEPLASTYKLHDDSRNNISASQKSTKKRSTLDDLASSLDNVEVLRDIFKKIFDQRKEEEGLSFKNVAEEIGKDNISSSTLSNFYHGDSKLRVGQNKRAVQEW
ncbi:741_t:CDS:2, partial [Acaulospora morrowiae]